MKQLTNKIALSAALAALFAAPLRAEDVKAGDLLITQAWSRATPSGAKVAGGYLTVENKGAAADRLVGGSGDVAGRVEIHEMAMDGGVMKMRPLDNGLVIDPGKTVKLAPGGYHLMLMDLKSQLKQGDKVPVTLQFEKAGKVHAVARRAGRRRAGARRRRSFRPHDEEVADATCCAAALADRDSACRSLRHGAAETVGASRRRQFLHPSAYREGDGECHGFAGACRAGRDRHSA